MRLQRPAARNQPPDSARKKHELRVARSLFKLPRFYPKFSLRTLLLAALLTGAALSLHTNWEPWVTVRVLTGHKGALTSASFSPDGMKIVTAGKDGTARIYDAESGAQLTVLGEHQGEVNVSIFTPDGARVLTCDEASFPNLWEPGQGNHREMFRDSRAHDMDLGDVARFSPDGNQLAVGMRNTVVAIWDTTEPETRFVRHLYWPRNISGIASLDYSSDGTRIFAATLDGKAGVWDAQTGALISSLSGVQMNFRSASFSPDGQRIVSAGDSCLAQLWSTDLNRPLGADAARRTLSWTACKLASLKGHTQYVLNVGFSPDGGRVITTSVDGTARVWDAADAGQLAVLRGHGSTVTSAAYASDGGRIVTASSDGTARVWELRRPEPLYGALVMPEFWVTLLLAFGLGWSLLRDSIDMSPLARLFQRAKLHKPGEAAAQPAISPQPPPAAG